MPKGRGDIGSPFLSSPNDLGVADVAGAIGSNADDFLCGSCCAGKYAVGTDGHRVGDSSGRPPAALVVARSRIVRSDKTGTAAKISCGSTTNVGHERSSVAAFVRTPHSPYDAARLAVLGGQKTGLPNSAELGPAVVRCHDHHRVVDDRRGSIAHSDFHGQLPFARRYSRPTPSQSPTSCRHSRTAHRLGRRRRPELPRRASSSRVSASGRHCGSSSAIPAGHCRVRSRPGPELAPIHLPSLRRLCRRRHLVRSGRDQ